MLCWFALCLHTHKLLSHSITSTKAFLLIRYDCMAHKIQDRWQEHTGMIASKQLSFGHLFITRIFSVRHARYWIHNDEAIISSIYATTVMECSTMVIVKERKCCWKPNNKSGGHYVDALCRSHRHCMHAQPPFSSRTTLQTTASSEVETASGATLLRTLLLFVRWSGVSQKKSA